MILLNEIFEYDIDHTSFSIIRRNKRELGGEKYEIKRNDVK